MSGINTFSVYVAEGAFIVDWKEPLLMEDTGMKELFSSFLPNLVTSEPPGEAWKGGEDQEKMAALIKGLGEAMLKAAQTFRQVSRSTVCLSDAELSAAIETAKKAAQMTLAYRKEGRIETLVVR